MTESSVLGCLNVVIESIWEHVQCLNLQKQPIKTIILILINYVLMSSSNLIVIYSSKYKLVASILLCLVHLI